MKWNKEMRKAMATASSEPVANRAKQCGACSGSGIYDTGGSPKCGSCNGTGVELPDQPIVNYKDYYADPDY